MKCLNPNIYLQKPGCRSSGRRTACIDQLPGKGLPSLFTNQDELSMHQGGTVFLPIFALSLNHYQCA